MFPARMWSSADDAHRTTGNLSSSNWCMIARNAVIVGKGQDLTTVEPNQEVFTTFLILSFDHGSPRLIATESRGGRSFARAHFSIRLGTIRRMK